MTTQQQQQDYPAVGDIVAIGGFITITRYLTPADPSYALVEPELATGLLGAPPHLHAPEGDKGHHE